MNLDLDLRRPTQTYGDLRRPTETYVDLRRPTYTYVDLCRPTQTQTQQYSFHVSLFTIHTQRDLRRSRSKLKKKKNCMSFLFILHGIQLKPKASNSQLLALGQFIFWSCVPFYHTRPTRSTQVSNPQLLALGLLQVQHEEKKLDVFSFHTTRHPTQSLEVSKQLLASSSRSVHIQVLCPLLPYAPYAVYVGLGPAPKKIICLFFPHYAVSNSNQK